MKDSEFLELLNLYLDHEITAADAARLEAEVQADPKRHEIYREYCRMQKACTLLARDFAGAPAEGKVVAFEPRRSAWSSGVFAMGGLAVAAACVALVLLNRTSNVAPDAVGATPDAMAVAANAPAAPSLPAAAREDAVVIARTVTTTPAHHSEGRALLTTMPLRLTDAKSSNAEALLAAAQQNSPAQFEWMKNVQLVPIQQLPLDDLRLDARSPLQPASRTYSSGHPVQGSVEMTAFRFQR
jgi:hypothetical protein